MFQTCFTFLEHPKDLWQESFVRNNIYKMKPGEQPSQVQNYEIREIIIRMVKAVAISFLGKGDEGRK